VGSSCAELRIVKKEVLGHRGGEGSCGWGEFGCEMHRRHGSSNNDEPVMLELVEQDSTERKGEKVGERKRGDGKTAAGEKNWRG